MATKITGPTVPSEFIRLDTGPTSADRYVNVRDQQLMRDNYNILLARRTKRFLCHVAFNEIGTTGYDIRSIRPVNSWASEEVFAIPCYLSPGTQELRVTLNAKRVSAATRIYFFCSAPGQQGTPHNDISINVSAAGYTEYSVDVPVPESGRQEGFVTLHGWIDGSTDTTNPITTTAVLDAGLIWFDIADAGLTGGSHAVYVTTDSEIAPRLITHKIQLNGTDYRYYLDTYWNKIPTPNSDTVNAYSARGINCLDCYVWELTPSPNSTTLDTYD